MERKCPLQVIEDKTSSSQRWLTLDKFIHHTGKGVDGTFGDYESICGFMDGKLHITELKTLLDGKNYSRILSSDIIRNPTKAEIEEINNTLMDCGYKLNLKTLTLTQK